MSLPKAYKINPINSFFGCATVARAVTPYTYEPLSALPLASAGPVQKLVP